MLCTVLTSSLNAHLFSDVQLPWRDSPSLLFSCSLFSCCAVPDAIYILTQLWILPAKWKLPTTYAVGTLYCMGLREGNSTAVPTAASKLRTRIQPAHRIGHTQRRYHKAASKQVPWCMQTM